MPANNGRARRQERSKSAALRNAAYAKLSLKEKLATLDPKGSKRQRDRLAALLVEKKVS